MTVCTVFLYWVEQHIFAILLSHNIDLLYIVRAQINQIFFNCKFLVQLQTPFNCQIVIYWTSDLLVLGNEWSHYQMFCVNLKQTNHNPLVDIHLEGLCLSHQDGINYLSWSDTVTSGKHTFHIIMVVTGPKSTEGSPTWDTWQRRWGECCLSRWLPLGC